MENQIKSAITSFWEEKLTILQNKINQSVQAMDDMLEVDAHYKYERSDQKRIGKALGEFGSSSIDSNIMADIFTSSNQQKTQDSIRINRIQKIHKQLKELQNEFLTNPPQCTFLSVQDEIVSILKQFEDNMTSLSNAFSLLRRAELEMKAKYEPQLHDKFYHEFNWKKLHNSEMSLCPPFIVMVGIKDLENQFIGQLIGLLASGKPIKCCVLQPGFSSHHGETGRETALKSYPDIGFLAVALRNVYVLQSSYALNDHLFDGIKNGLSSPRPTLFSLFHSSDEKEVDLSLAHKALKSRTFPHFNFDPDKSTNFVACLDLTINPNHTERWAAESLTYQSKSEGHSKLEIPMTFADYVFNEKSFKDQFIPIPEGSDKLDFINISEYLSLSSKERAKKIPFVYSSDKQSNLTRYIPSKFIITQSMDKMHLWRSLQELSGIHNPYIIENQKRIKEELEQDKKQTINALKSRMESKLIEREKKAITLAMKHLAAKLTGLESSDAPLILPSKRPPDISKEVEPTPPPVSPKEEIEEVIQTQETSDEVWIETALCTSCDECTKINKNIFVYNDDKKAVVKDPKGGPFRDIVRAAVKCSASIIHPGKPQDPNEKNLEKWIKRAQEFQ